MFLEPYPSEDCLSPVDRADVQLCQNNCPFRPAVPCDRHLQLPDGGVTATSSADAYQAVDLYLHLKNEIRSALSNYLY